MRFLVFIKQVPEVSDIRFDPKRKTLIREGVRNGINPYDRRAISETIHYRDENGGEVVVATMGPPQAREALQEALIMGADRAVHILDTRLAGSDTLATSRVLAAVARKIGFDLILCGQHSTDSETAQVPPELAEFLEIPCAVAVRKIEYLEGVVRVSCETDEGTTVLELSIPAVLSTAERLIKPIKVKEVPLTSAPAEKITAMKLEDLKVAEEDVGLGGSPTWVATIEEKSIPRTPEVWNIPDPQEAARRILETIRAQTDSRSLPVVPTGTNSGKEFWCLMEFDEERIRSVSLEMLSTAAALTAKKGGQVCAVWPAARPDAEILSSYGADKVYQVASTPHPDEMVSLLCDKIVAIKPFAILIAATSAGKYLAPRIAARLKLGLTGDCVGLDLDNDGNLVQLKPAFGGNVVARIYSKTFPQMVTVRPGALESYHPRSPSGIPVISWDVPSGIPRRLRIVAQESDPGRKASKMDHAEIVIGVGMGLGQENVSQAFQLAELLGAAVGATRRVVDSGWLQRQYQVGLTGKFIAPRVYLALGVSGRANHTIGIQKAGKIIAINQDPNAEIFRACDIGVVGDCVQLTKQMIQLLGS